MKRLVAKGKNLESPGWWKWIFETLVNKALEFFLGIGIDPKTGLPVIAREYDSTW